MTHKELRQKARDVLEKSLGKDPMESAVMSAVDQVAIAVLQLPDFGDDLQQKAVPNIRITGGSGSTPGGY